jgi:iron complex transport system substrate-binding protein
LGGENLATGLNGEGLFVFAGDQKDVDAIYANPLLAHLPAVENKRVWALAQRRSAWIITARCWF